MANKKTVVEMFTEIMNVPGLTQEQKDFLARRIELTNKKNANGANKPTKTQVENEGIKEQILSILSSAEQPMTVADIMEAVGIDSNQKVTSLLTQLKKNDKVIRTEVKGKAYYALPSAEAEVED